MKTAMILVAAAGLTPALALAQLQTTAAFLNVIQNDAGNTEASVSGSLSTIIGGPMSYVGGTRGDFGFRFGAATPADDVSSGIMMVSLSQNGRSNQGGTINANPAFATPAIQLQGNLGTPNPSWGGYASSINVSNNNAGAGSGSEWNANQAVAYFPYSRFIGAWATNGTHGATDTNNNNALTGFVSSSAGLTLGSGATDPGTFNVFDSTGGTAGQYNVRLGGLSAGVSFGPGGSPITSVAASSQNGVLLVTGGKNEDNYALSQANSDGSFTILTRDNGADGFSGENDPAAFVYVPLNHQDTAAVGRIDAEGDTIIGSGIFTVTKGATGEWFLSTPGFTDANSVLIISPEGSSIAGTNRADNIWSYQWDSTNTRWVIQGRDIPASGTTTPGLQDLTANEPAFSFVLIPTPGAATLMGLGLVAAGRRRR
jgi:hypothetical protein